jgi:CheY-like chemotaxis protein
MSCVVLEPAVPIRQSLLKVLASMGVRGVPASTVAEAEAAIRSSGDVEAIIVDTDTPALGGLELLARMRAAQETRALRVVAHSGQTSREFVLQLAELGVAGYLPRGASVAQASERLKGVLTRAPDHEGERKHWRVRPDPNELLRLHFRLSGHKGIVSGRVVDISMGGVGVELFNPPPPIRMRPGRLIPSLELTLGRTPIATPGTLVTSRGKFCAIRFDNMSASVKDTVARYIYRQSTD